MKKLFDRHGEEIFPGMVLTDPDGVRYYVFSGRTLYVTPAQPSRKESAACAARIDQGNEELEFYPLTALNLTEWSIEKES